MTQHGRDHDAHDAHEPPEPADERAPGLGRRRLVGGAIAAAAAAVAMDRTRPAAAADGDNVRAGMDVSATATTQVTHTGTTSATGFRATASSARYGTGIEGVGTAYGVKGTGNEYAGVSGDSYAGSGVTGLSRATSGFTAGVRGYSESPSGAGVVGSSEHVVGVVGWAGFGVVRWPTGTPIGVYAEADDPNGIGGVFTGRRAPLRLIPGETSGPPAAGDHEVGELVVDGAGRVFVCTAAGSPGAWNELGAPVPPVPPPGARPTLQLLPTPERFVDTRLGLGGVQGVVPADSTHTFSMTGRDGQAGNPALRVPDTATALVGNLTVIGAPGTPGAYLTMWPGGDRPTVSNINFGPNSVGDAIANGFTVGLADTDGGHRGLRLYNFGPCDYIIDVTGYYVMA